MTNLSHPDGQKPRPPGEYIRDELKARGWTQEDLARILGRPLPTVNEIIQGKRAIMPEMAIALGTAFGTSPEIWVQREGLYRLSLADTDGRGDIKRRAQLYELAPVKEMQKRGWIPPTDTVADLEREVLRFFEIPTLDAEPSLGAAMRKSEPTRPLTPAQRAWCFRIKSLARALRVGQYDPAKLDHCAAELRKLAAFPQSVKKVPQLLAAHGIRFVIVEPLTGGKVDGMATWLEESSPVIGMSLRFDRMDAFWFTLGHEFSHIRHRDAVSVDSDAGNQDHDAEGEKPAFEQRADEEAAALLVPPDMLQSFIQRVGPLYSKERINQFANRIKMHPGIIVGQLQHRGEIGYQSHRDTLVKIRQTVAAAALTDGWGHSIDLKGTP